ncbi:preprotein translocase subunit SecY [bacterium]|nr:preprotein translocase subunit SecY [candidate division CSSED10-310 bacterium]
MWEAINNVFKIPELKRRIMFTLALLAVYRMGTHIPIPGVDSAQLAKFMSEHAEGIFGFLDMFSGGAFNQMTVFALGIMPYISASIILQLMTVVVPALERLSKEGEAGRKKITQYTRYGTVGLSLIQSLGIAIGLEGMRGGTLVNGGGGWGFRVMTMITLTAGTAFIMWLGEQITERGIGNGISLIIFAGIVAGVPRSFIRTIQQIIRGDMRLTSLIAILIIIVIVTAATVMMQQAQRRLPVQYAKRVVGRRMMGGSSTHIPIRINSAGVMPVIFASSIIMFPVTILKFAANPDRPFVQWLFDNLQPGSLMYIVIYIAAIIFFTYFYTAIIFNPVDLADNMKKYGGFIPGIRPGRNTSQYIDRVLTRITLVGALFLSAIAVLPTFLYRYLDVQFYFGGTALLIVVGVGLDTIQQIESHLLMRHYNGFLRKGRIRGGRR